VERLVVCGLRLGEAGPIDTIVDVRVHPLVDGVDLVAHAFGIQVDVALAPLVELRVQHPHDVRRLVRDDDAVALVPEHGNRVTPTEVGS
jgi:hypothetical protein